MNTSSTVPALLIVGADDKTLHYAETFLQRQLCQNAATQPGCFCSICRKIKARQHHNVVWLIPEKGYTVEDIDVIFERTSRALDDHEQCFFILAKSQTLTSAAANRILKVLEEPPRGYSFILLTDNHDALLATIRSRCMVTNLEQSNGPGSGNQLLTFFSPLGKKKDPIGLETELKKQHLTEHQSIDLLYELITQYAEAIKTTSDDQRSVYYIAILEYLLIKAKKPPQSGSSELFWKHLYLSWPVPS